MVPAIFSAFLICFAISFDEVVVASFVAGDQVTFPRLPATRSCGCRGGCRR